MAAAGIAAAQPAFDGSTAAAMAAMAFGAEQHQLQPALNCQVPIVGSGAILVGAVGGAAGTEPIGHLAGGGMAAVGGAAAQGTPGCVLAACLGAWDPQWLQVPGVVPLTASQPTVSEQLAGKQHAVTVQQHQPLPMAQQHQLLVMQQHQSLEPQPQAEQQQQYEPQAVLHQQLLAAQQQSQLHELQMQVLEEGLASGELVAGPDGMLPLEQMQLVFNRAQQIQEQLQTQQQQKQQVQTQQQVQEQLEAQQQQQRLLPLLQMQQQTAEAGGGAPGIPACSDFGATGPWGPDYGDVGACTLKMCTCSGGHDGTPTTLQASGSEYWEEAEPVSGKGCRGRQGSCGGGWGRGVAAVEAGGVQQRHQAGGSGKVRRRRVRATGVKITKDDLRKVRGSGWCVGQDFRGSVIFITP